MQQTYKHMKFPGQKNISRIRVKDTNVHEYRKSFAVLSPKMHENISTRTSIFS